MRSHSRRLAAVFAIAFAAAAPAQQPRAELTAPDRSQPLIEAVWKEQSFDFEYRGASTSYSCDSLRRRLRSILITVGARETLDIYTTGCYDLSNTARLHVTMSSPVEATPENIRALTQHGATDELLARVRGESVTTSADVERFPAVWRTISMSRNKQLKLAPSDCELVQQLRHQVFPRLAIRIVQDNLHCSRAFGNIGRPQLAVAALVAAP